MNRAKTKAALEFLAEAVREEGHEPYETTRAPSLPGCPRCAQLADEARVVRKRASEALKEFEARCTAQADIESLSTETVAAFHGFDVVYFVQACSGGPIKIGTTSLLPTRLRDLQNCSPVPLVVRAIISGDAGIESALHEEFRELRLHGEWFSPHVNLLARIAAFRRNA